MNVRPYSIAILPLPARFSIARIEQGNGFHHGARFCSINAIRLAPVTPLARAPIFTSSSRPSRAKL